MSCVLRVSGKGFNVDAFLADSPFEPDDVFEKGESLTGFNLTVSAASPEDLETQVDDAMRFLDEHEEELRRLTGFDGVDIAFLDFAVRWRDVAVHVDTFPSDFIWRAGALDISLTVSHYPPRGES